MKISYRESTISNDIFIFKEYENTKDIFGYICVNDDNSIKVILPNIEYNDAKSIEEAKEFVESKMEG